jgi:o-succinylbenzoate synthase
MRETFKIARGAVGSPDAGAPHVYVRLTSDDGTEGWGEARPSPRWSYETLETVTTTLRNYLVPAIIGMNAADFGDLYGRMESEIAPGITIGQPIAKSAIEMAVQDLICRKKGISLQHQLGGSNHRSWPMGLLVSAESTEEAERKAGLAADKGFTVLKVKIGVNPKSDTEILEAVRRAAPKAYLWADANQSYDLAMSLALAKQGARNGIDVLEQPLAANDYWGHRELRRHSQIPIALDESVFSITDLEQMFRLECLDALVIKVSKMAGLFRARQCIEVAREMGLDVLGSGLTESRMGFFASAALYAALGVDKCDLNGPQFLADDAVEGPFPGALPMVDLPLGPGIGVSIDRTKLSTHAWISAI